MTATSPGKPRLEIKVEKLSETQKKEIRAALIREYFLDFMWIWLIVTFLTLGAGRILSWLLSAEVSRITVLCCAVGLGVFSSLLILLMNRRSFVKVLIDLHRKQREVLSVVPEAGYAVILANGKDALKLACGDQSVILQNRWWRNKIRTDIKWEGEMDKDQFPSTYFVVTRLPVSGRVIGVKNYGAHLTISNRSLSDAEMENDIDPASDCLFFRNA